MLPIEIHELNQNSHVMLSCCYHANVMLLLYLATTVMLL